MRKAITAAVLLSAVATAGCATRGRAPDEFAVARNAPLIVPPDFNLAPPVAGTAGLTAGEAQQQAVDALFGGPAPRSAAETSMLDAAGRERRAARHPFEPVESGHAYRRQGAGDRDAPAGAVHQHQHRFRAQ